MNVTNVNVDDNVITICEAIALTLHSVQQFIQVHTGNTLSEQPFDILIMWRMYSAYGAWHSQANSLL